ncbi:MAG: tRNA pseudouridine(38-40) synthase TruA, partial [Actinomyces sp.]
GPARPRPAVTPPPPGRVRVRMTFAYHGAPFHGFAANPGVVTVEGTLVGALTRVLGHEIDLSCAGRTDKGVHARGQVVSFDADASRLDPPRLAQALNRMLAPDIAVRSVAPAAPDFDARHSCVARSYRYRVLNTPVHDPLLADVVWHVARPLDLAAMRLACDPIIGEHDFSTFCRRRRDRRDESLTRQVLAADWRREGGVLRFDVTATAFCHQMVRALVGHMVAVGAGRRRAGEMRAALEARDRHAVASPAPPQGLVLWSAHYPPDPAV